MNMMSQIESCADKLASDIKSGKMNMENLSFNDISNLGQSVLSQCSTEDMEQLSRGFPQGFFI